VALHNLLGQRAEVHAAGRKVKLAVRIEGKALLVEVSDTGIGIGAAMLNRLVLSGMTYLIPMYLELVKGYSTGFAGLLLFAPSLLIMVTGPVAHALRPHELALALYACRHPPLHLRRPVCNLRRDDRQELSRYEDHHEPDRRFTRAKGKEVFQRQKENLEAIGYCEGCLEDKVWVADSNYSSPANLEVCEKEKLDAYIPDKRFRRRDPRFHDEHRQRQRRSNRLTVADFQYQEEKDEYVCPKGKVFRLQGKGTVAKLLTDFDGSVQISTGDILRSAVKAGTELGKKAQGYMERGELVPDSLIMDIMGSRLQEPDCRKGFILDGFPRTIPQAEALKGLLQKLKLKLDLVVNLDVPREVFNNFMNSESKGN
jgi:hypothetical protein